MTMKEKTKYSSYNEYQEHTFKHNITHVIVAFLVSPQSIVDPRLSIKLIIQKS